MPHDQGRISGSITDSETGDPLGARADQRFGGVSVKNVTVWQEGDAEHDMNYWASRLDEKLVLLGAGKQTASASAAN